MVLVTRRSLLSAAAVAAGSLPLRAVAAPASGFTHGIASGDPLATRVILWTRFVSAKPVTVIWEVAEDADFKSIVRSGKARPSAARDHTIKVDADRLAPGRRYFYRFRSGSQSSSVGRTRTLPRGRADHLKLALFSCANLPFGYFNAYKHCAAREDIDIALHVGDYIYEYPRGVYPSARDAMIDRVIEPATEIVHLQDYRARYQSYRTDADLQALHAALPMICIWDDHEFANDTWRGGAENHQPGNEGPWDLRWRAAVRAYDEWLPVRMTQSPIQYRSFQWGNLASLIFLDTRFIGRDVQMNYKRDLHALSAVPRPEELSDAVKDFRPRWQDPKRSMLGAAQEAWLARQLARSSGAGIPWQIIAQQILFGYLRQASDTGTYLRADAASYVRDRVNFGGMVATHGLPTNLDNWSGYPAARERLLAAVKAHARNAVLLAGDSHNAWAFEVPGGENGNPLLVEVGGHSVTSSGLEASFERVDALAQSLIRDNSELKWAQLHGRGYVTIDITPARLEAQWHFLDTVRDRKFKLASTVTAHVAATSGLGVGRFSWS